MLSVGSRGGREVGLGFGVGGKMVETEFEDGEASSFRSNDDDETIDPDVALSYIDEKLQHVLGHLQKDFEGGVSAENLGSKFGGYGSFLPTYQRSPAWTHRKTPEKVQNYNGQFVNNTQVEVGHGNSVLPSTSSPLRAGSMSSQMEHEESRSNDEPMKSSHASENKSLKVRIKMGSDNLSTQRNAKIYSGLGLDVSLPFSIDGSPADSEGCYQKLHNDPDESPTSILRIMTSFPVDGNLLSPLPYDLVCLSKKGKLSVKTSGHKGSQEGSLISAKESDYVRSIQRVPIERKVKAHENISVSDVSKKCSVFGVMVKEEADTKGLACEELVSNVMRLPLLSNPCPNTVELAKGANADGWMKVASLSSMEKEDSLHPAVIGGKSWVEKPDSKDGPIEKVSENDKPSNQHEFHDSINGGYIGGYQGDVSAEKCTDLQEQKDDQKVMFFVKVESKPSSMNEMSASRGRNNSKSSQSHGQAVTINHEGSKRSLKTDSASLTRNTKKNVPDGQVSNGDTRHSRKDHGKARERYEDLFDEPEIEDENRKLDLEEKKPSGDRPEESTFFELSKLEKNSSSKGRIDGKENPKPSSTTNARAGTYKASQAASESVSDADNWVQCDKCHKWRLLPLGKDLKSLPEKWLCTMLDWLPAMNSCTFSEEETTNAVTYLNHLAPMTQSSQHIPPGRVLSGVVGGTTLHINENHRHPGSQILAADGKKKHETKDAPNQTKHDGSKWSSSSSRNLKTPLKGRNLHGEKQSPTMNGVIFQDSGHSCSSVGEKHMEKKRENKGDMHHCKIQGKREADQDWARDSKKIKTHGHRHASEDRGSDLRGAELKTVRGSSCDLPGGSGKFRHKYDSGLKDSKGLFRNPDGEKSPTSQGGSLNIGKYANKDIPKKRKSSEHENTWVNTQLQKNRDYVDERKESGHRKEKKARSSLSLKDETGENKGSGETVKRTKNTRDEQPRSLEVTYSSTGALRHAQASGAAISSSSKVSDSKKARHNFQELRGSPVESVSSSPMRLSNPNKSISTRRDLGVVDESQNVDPFALSSSKIHSDEKENLESCQVGAVKKDETSIDAHLGSLESSFLERELVSASGKKGIGRVVDSPEYAAKKGSKEDMRNASPSPNTGSHPKKIGNGTSGDKSQSSKSDSDKINFMVPECKEYVDNSHSEEKILTQNNRFPESLCSDKVEKNPSTFEKELCETMLSESAKPDNHLKCVDHDGSTGRLYANHAISSQDPEMDHDGRKSSKRLSDRTNCVNASEQETIHPLPPSGRGKKETPGLRLSVSGSRKENTGNKGENALDGPKQHKKAENKNGNQMNSSTQAANSAVKEGKDLKHLADRLKNSGKDLESTGLYFQAALKFLHGASLLESCSIENGKYSDMLQSMTIYSSTAKLCEFCGREYEKSKEMAAAALAYKCSEAAYLKVVYSSHSTASKDRHELQTALHIVPTGESPSSSASDLDNLNNPVTVDKTAVGKGVNSPQVAANHVIAASNRPNFVRLLNFAQDVNFAMEASKKSQHAFSASHLSQDGVHHKEGISSVKRALDFSFQDMDGLVRLIRLAMEAISR